MISTFIFLNKLKVYFIFNLMIFIINLNNSVFIYIWLNFKKIESLKSEICTYFLRKRWCSHIAYHKSTAQANCPQADL